MTCMGYVNYHALVPSHFYNILECNIKINDTKAEIVYSTRPEAEEVPTADG